MSLSVVAYGAALSISILFGAGPLPLKLHRAAIASVVGLVCLASVAVDRSLFLILVRRPTKIGGLSSMQGKQAVVRPRTAKTLTYLTLIVGVACLADAALQTALA
jgi:hypothetical protein